MVMSKNETVKKESSPSLSQTVFTKEYCLNQYNILRGFSLVVCLILFFISLLYCCSSLYQLELAAFWCDEYNYDEILQHNRAINSDKGIGGCYRDKRKGLYFDHGKLFSKNDESDAFMAKMNGNVSALNVLELLLFSIPVCGFAILFSYYLFICFIDCRKTLHNKWSNRHNRTQFSPDQQIYCWCHSNIDTFCAHYFPHLFNNFVKYYHWRKKKFGYDKPGAILSLLVKQLAEIFLQS